MNPTDRLIANLPNPDDILRRLSDALEVPRTCRRRACRTEMRCQGGYGPPCYLAQRNRFGDAVAKGLFDIRRSWDERRAQLKALLRGVGETGESRAGCRPGSDWVD